MRWRIRPVPIPALVLSFANGGSAFVVRRRAAFSGTVARCPARTTPPLALRFLLSLRRRWCFACSLRRRRRVASLAPSVAVANNAPAQPPRNRRPVRLAPAVRRLQHLRRGTPRCPNRPPPCRADRDDEGEPQPGGFIVSRMTSRRLASASCGSPMGGVSVSPLSIRSKALSRRIIARSPSCRRTARRTRRRKDLSVSFANPPFSSVYEPTTPPLWCTARWSAPACLADVGAGSLVSE